MNLTKQQQKTRSELESAFTKLEVARAGAVELLNKHSSGFEVRLPESNRLIRRIRTINEKFSKAWRRQRIGILKTSGSVASVLASDYYALADFLKENKINEGVEGLLAGPGVILDRFGRIKNLVYKAPKADSSLIVEPLEQLQGLKDLSIGGRPSDCTKLAKLRGLEVLDFEPRTELYEIKRKDIKLESPALDNAQGAEDQKQVLVGVIDISPLRDIRTLNSVSVSNTKLDAKSVLVSGFAPLADIPLLKYITLENTLVDSNLVGSSFPQLLKLACLTLSSCKVEDLSILDYAPALTALLLDHSVISCPDIKYPPGLKTLFLSGCKVEQLAALLRPLLELEHLASVSLWAINHECRVPISEEAMDLIKQIRNKPVAGQSNKFVDVQC